MNKNQAFKLACIYNAQYLMTNGAFDSLHEHLSDIDIDRFSDAQKELARRLMIMGGLRGGEEEHIPEAVMVHIVTHPKG